MELEVRHLRVVCAIAETGSLTRAAAALRLTQPGISAQLRRIESVLGGRIFERCQTGVTTTPFGELVLTRARAILPGVDDLLATTARATRTRSAPHRVRLGSVGAPLLSGLALAVRSLLPGVEITSRAGQAPQSLLDDIAADRLEAAVVGDSPGYELVPPDGVVLQPVITEPVFALLPADHPLAAMEEVCLDRLAEEDWAGPPPDDRTREYWASVLALTDHRARIPYEADGRVLIEIVRAGLAVSLCQATFLEVPGVVIRPLQGDPLWYRHVLAWHRDGPLAPVGEAVLARVRERHRASGRESGVYSRWRERRAEVKPARAGRDVPAGPTGPGKAARGGGQGQLPRSVVPARGGPGRPAAGGEVRHRPRGTGIRP
ncbi:LysR family transcriptional regulator [Streptomyces cinnamoneus]|uniref:LysR family transcriptional regulator n=1 Tax=Streptomyces cinnamoneus TaxID=53446 RepID=A0A2G1XNT7_STRCJ|nr:LysR family transcriptional regulator [Streptomyces cinnamoneus]PHQ52851.1 LysR family transcriptional regulator [Streptomyces cinnamoneus]